MDIKCKKCKKIKSESEFYYNKKRERQVSYTCKTCWNIRTNIWKKNHQGGERVRLKKWKESNKNRVRKIQRNWYQKYQKRNPKYKIDRNIKSIIWQVLKGKKAGRKWQELVGYTLQNLIVHLEKQFDDKMSWENYGNYWWIDHIKPKSLFKYETPDDEEFKKCWALSNLQPLEKIANIKKSNKF